MHTGTGNDQIADSRKTAEGLELSSHGRSQPGNLRDSACDQRSLRIVAVSQSVCNTGSQGDDIFKGSAQFDALHVRAGIDAEYLTHKDGLNVLSGLPAVRARDTGGGKSPAHLFRMAGAR